MSLPALVQVEVARAHLDGELVERQVPLGQPQRFGQLVLPILERLARAGIDQVEARAREDRLRQPHGGDGFVDRVAAAQFGQRAFAQRLHAERDAVDAGGAVAAEAVGLDRGRVGFERDLGVRIDRPVLRRWRRGCAPTERGSISEGVPPPKKIDCTVRPGASSREMRDLALVGLDISLLRRTRRDGRAS